MRKKSQLIPKSSASHNTSHIGTTEELEDDSPNARVPICKWVTGVVSTDSVSGRWELHGSAV